MAKYSSKGFIGSVEANGIYNNKDLRNRRGKDFSITPACCAKVVLSCEIS